MSLLGVAVLLLALAFSWWGTGRVRRFALARTVLDVPNERSSHSTPTPRGGGLAIAAVVLAGMTVAALAGLARWQLAVALVPSGGAMALLGWLDDRRSLPAWTRLVVHVIAASWVIHWLGPVRALSIGAGSLPLGWLAIPLSILGIVWLVNLFNFMDGIDGIASVEAITVSLGGTLLYGLVVSGTTHWLAPLVVVSATLGFLVWNWPPAKIFMGDAGSGFLGLMLGALSLHAAWVAPRLFWSWVILLGAFVVDATVTLIRRVVRGERFYEAHRSHAYQHAAQRWGAHLPVTVAVGAINLCWLLPIALLVALGSLDGLLGVFVAYTPIVAAALWLRAGKPAAA
ncbi:MAG: glycosyltransferase family 4 protein [Gemmatimonadales bacterium]